MNEKVTVIGAGRMGSALAAALSNKGFVTTVWNRTAAKTEPLSRLECAWRKVCWRQWGKRTW